MSLPGVPTPDANVTQKVFQFEHRFRGARKGSSLPKICALDWSPKPGNYDHLLAFCTEDKVRGFCHNGVKWKTALNRRPARRRKPNTLKWNPAKPAVLAVGCGYAPDGIGGTIIKLELRGERFRNVKTCRAPEGGCIASLSWDPSGKYLLATVTPDDLNPHGYMFVVKYTSDSRSITKTIKCQYNSPWTATFHTRGKSILSTSETSKEILIWHENMFSFNWEVVSKIPCPDGIINISFDSRGDYLTAMTRAKMMIFHYTDQENGAPSQPAIEEVYFEEVSAVNLRSKGVTLEQHCKQIISSCWSSESKILTGSSSGSICVHELFINVKPKAQSSRYTGFYAIYLRSSVNTTGQVTCVAWSPQETHLVASVGEDGLVIIWNLVDDIQQPDRHRNHFREESYFLPKYPPAANSKATDVDVISVSSISSESDYEEEAFSYFEQENTSERDEILEDESASAGDLSQNLLKIEDKLQIYENSLNQIFSALRRVMIKLVQSEEGLNTLTTGNADGTDTIVSQLEDFDSKLQSLESMISNERTDGMLNLEEKLSELEEAVSLARVEVGRLKEKHANMANRIVQWRLQLEETVQKRHEELVSTVTTKFSQMKTSIEDEHEILEKDLELKLNQIESNAQTNHEQLKDKINGSFANMVTAIGKLKPV